MLLSTGHSRGKPARMRVWHPRPPRYGGKNAAPSRRARACPSPCCCLPDIRGGNPLACACGIRGPRATMKKTPPLHVGRGPVPRHAAVYRKLARACPSPYGIGKAVGPSDVREGQALALRGRVTHRDREVSPTGGSRDRERVPPDAAPYDEVGSLSIFINSFPRRSMTFTAMRL